MWPEYRRKDYRGGSCCLHPLERDAEVDQRPGGVVISSTCFVSSWCGASGELSEAAENQDVFHDLELLPRGPPIGKADVKMNEMYIKHILYCPNEQNCRFNTATGFSLCLMNCSRHLWTRPFMGLLSGKPVFVASFPVYDCTQ